MFGDYTNNNRISTALYHCYGVRRSGKVSQLLICCNHQRLQSDIISMKCSLILVVYTSVSLLHDPITDMVKLVG